jgi:hypothetical protein
MSSPLSALPTVPETALPADVRRGSRADKQTYQAALGFERALLSQLLKTATQDAPLADGPQGAAVQDAFADAVVSAGGTGLARTLYASLKGQAS